MAKDETTKAEKKGEEASKEDSKAKKGKKEAEDISEEDMVLIEQMQLLVTRSADSEKGIRINALTAMAKEIREATSSMTSVPKPLKFLRPHYANLKEHYVGETEQEVKLMLADVLSVLAMTMADDGQRESLEYKLLGSGGQVGAWGHEYVRHLAAEVGEEYNARLAAADTAADKARSSAKAAVDGPGAPSDVGDDAMETEVLVQPAELLLPLVVDEMVPFFVQNNAEAEAIDLLMEVGKLEALTPHVDATNCDRICMYLVQVAQYVPEPEDAQVLQVAITVLSKLGKYPEALRLALRLQDDEAIAEIMGACKDTLVTKQMALMLSRQGVRPDLDEELDRLMDGTHLPEHYQELARDLDVLEPKTPDDIYKTHLEKRPASAAAVDSARANLASTFVNAFVNLGFGADKLMLTEGNKWLYKNKEHGMMSAAASLGALLAWDVDGGLTQIDKFLYMTDINIKAGALLAVGILNSGVRNECEPALALLTEYVEPGKTNPQLKMGAMLGLGLAYIGTAKEEVLELLMPVVSDLDTPLEVVAMAALSLGLVFSGSCHEDIAQALMSVLMERDAAALEKDSLTRLICVGAGLLYMGRQGQVEIALELAKAVPGQVGAYCTLTLETCAYTGTGNVLKVQRLLGLAGEHLQKDEDDEDEPAAATAAAPAAASAAAPGPRAAAAAAAAGGSGSSAPKEKEWPKLDAQSVATLGVALVAGGEELGTEMTIRNFNHIFQYGDVPVRRAVPLGLAMLATSKPSNTNGSSVVDTLSKMTHDQDVETATNAIFAMGLCAGGTNNSKVASTLRSLATYYAKEPGLLFAVRIAQGLVHAGKGLVTLSPYHPDRSLPHRNALAALIAICHVSLDFKGLVLGKHHFLLYLLVAAMRPRMLITVDAELKPLPVTVRVGTSVDVVGLAGRPKTITGFQTHTTPVLLQIGERAELATDEYLPLTAVLEGVVILKKNPDFQGP